MSASRLLSSFCLLVLWTGAAEAALKVCNQTGFTQSVSVGYRGEADWTSEGWWNIEPGDCVTPLAGDLTERYLYYRAEIDGGDFDGQDYFFCTSPQEYTIVGDSDCESRGHDREDFAEIDVGDGVTDYTLTLVADAQAAVPDPAAAGDETGLRICNETTHTQAVSIGYRAEAGWTSEGWWNVAPNDCATVVSGPLATRYYYYRAEIDGGPFDHGDYFFCTTPQEYTILGDTDCDTRGYDRENFAEIDTGTAAQGFTLTLVSDSAEPAPEAAAGDGPEGLRVCNETAFVQALSVGYEGEGGWTSEGWWNIDPQDCAQILGEALTKRYYYYRAEIEGGEFPGGGYFFCTTPQEYTIVGDTDCEARGYDREDFAEFDVGATTAYTLRLVAEPGESGGVAGGDTESASSAADGGLRICNETAHVQSVSIGYQGEDDGWVSEGWWNLDPEGCATVIAGALKKRYYYYRAEIDGGPFEGGGYGFCTSPQEYTILGDTECEARGYDREDFAEIDTGPTAKSFVFTLVDAERLQDEPELFEEPAMETPAEPPADPAEKGTGAEGAEDAGAMPGEAEAEAPMADPLGPPETGAMDNPDATGGPSPRRGGSRGN